MIGGPDPCVIEPVEFPLEIECGFPRQLPGGEDNIPTTQYYCQVGQFHWDLLLDGECPNHGVHRSGPMNGDDGPHDSEGVPYLGCCSLPIEGG